MIPYLPPGYDASTGLNTGNLGYMSLPVEKTVGGWQQNIWNPDYNPFPNGGPTDDQRMNGADDGFNPWLQGYFKNGQWTPLLPDKIVYGQRGTPWAPGVSTQTVNGQTANINPGGPAYARTPFSTAAAVPSRTEAAPNASPFSGFLFGNNGSAGRVGGTFGNMTPGQSTPFYQDQPSSMSAATPGLGTFSPWEDPLKKTQPVNPGIQALQQYRSQP